MLVSALLIAAALEGSWIWSFSDAASERESKDMSPPLSYRAVSGWLVVNGWWRCVLASNLLYQILFEGFLDTDVDDSDEDSDESSLIVYARGSNDRLSSNTDAERRVCMK